MSDHTASTGPRPAKKNPAPPLRRVFRHYDVTIGKDLYEIHPGPQLGGGLTVYQRTKAGLHRVNDRMKAMAVIREYDAQNKRARELAAQIARTEAARKPVVIRNEPFWRSWWRMLRRWTESKRAQLAAWRRPMPEPSPMKAVQWTGDPASCDLTVVGLRHVPGHIERIDKAIELRTARGKVLVPVGHWIIKGADGQLSVSEHAPAEAAHA